MAELRAQGQRPHERWRRRLPEGEAVVVGRDCGFWSVPWDAFVSRCHARVRLTDNRLQVERLPEATNPVFQAGAERERFEIGPGEHFVIGLTTFYLGAEQTQDAATDQELLADRTISAPELARLPARDARHQLDVLSQLPQVILGATDDAELFLRLTGLLLAGVPRADVAALVVHAADGQEPEVLHWEARLARADFRSSRRLVEEAIGLRQQATVHLWRAEADHTRTDGREDIDWALCVPLHGAACKGWGIYLAGRLTPAEASTALAPLEQHALADDLKFTELVGSTLSSLRQVQALERRQSSLGTFFSPAVVRVLANADPEDVLQAREEEVAVLFCDLRGFSRQSEQQAEHLLALLQRVSRALGVMTKSIFDRGGVIADYQGDAALGFWGWPVPQPNKVEQACLAALEIRSLVEASAQQPEHPLAGFRVGIGVATGRAVAGKIGTAGQAKVGVFGPVVNLASRLEGMTKLLSAPILVDERTAEAVRAALPPAVCRCRRLAVVQPYGMETPLTVCELLPGGGGGLSDEHVQSYEAALDHFIAGRWEQAYALLHTLPPWDRVKDFLIGHIIQHNRMPPPGWAGFISLASKG